MNDAVQAKYFCYREKNGKVKLQKTLDKFKLKTDEDNESN